MGNQAPFVSTNSETEAFSRRARQTRILMDATRDLMNNPRPSSKQIEAYKELFYQLADRVLPADKRLVSTLLAHSAFTPRSVAIYLAQDSLDIAIPCLLYSPVLSDMDLKTIAGKMGTSYRDVIAKRIKPSTSDGDANIETVKSDLEETSQARSSSLKGLFSRAPNRPTLVEERQNQHREILDNPADDTDEAEWLAGEEIVALASAGGRLGRKAQKRPEATEPTTLSEEAPATSKKRIESLARRKTRHLLALARRQNREGLVKEIGKLSGLEESAISALLRKERGDEIAYLVKALNPCSPQDLRLLLLIAPRYGRSGGAYRSAKTLLGQIDAGICRMIFNQVGANFDLPKSDFVEGPGTEFARAIRTRREEISHIADGRSAELRPATPAARRKHAGSGKRQSASV